MTYFYFVIILTSYSDLLRCENDTKLIKKEIYFDYILIAMQ